MLLASPLSGALSHLNEREKSMEWAERAVVLEGEEPQALCNMACFHSLLGEADKAVDCLEKSVTHGWVQREWMEHDPNLASLRGHPRFRALVHASRT